MISPVRRGALVRSFSNDVPNAWGGVATAAGSGGGGTMSYQGNGQQYWKQGVTLSVRTLWETPFARFQIHSVQLDEGSGGSSRIIDDWLWFDECDNVNILVQSAGKDEFLVLEQTKYAIEGKTYAVIGGLIEAERDQNDSLTAAKRELMEELHMEAGRWTFLGSFVAAANRGGGKTFVYLAQDATPLTNGRPDEPEGIAEGELERQNLLRLSRAELLEALLNGKFQEIKWTATVALALLKEASVAP